MRLAEYELAERAYGEAIRLHPDQAVLWSNRGQARLRRDDRRGAEADFRAALARDANFASALQGLAQLRDAVDSERGQD
jgi:cytochrome c-type biogenesis protein CcmH/NrfG